MEYNQDKYPLIWKRTSNKGYCFTARIPCRAVERVGKRIRIAALLVSGKERLHVVEERSLEHDPCRCFAGCIAMDGIPVSGRKG